MVLDGQTVVVEGKRILDIVPSGEPLGEIPVFDAEGSYLCPGLADMHVHFNDSGEALLFLANGVTTVRNMWGSTFHLAWQDRIDSGDLPGPRMFTTSPIVDGAGPAGGTSWPSLTP